MLSKKGEEVETRGSSRNHELLSIEEEEKNNGSREPTMAASNYRCNSNNNGLEEKKNEDSISIVSLECKLYRVLVDAN
jgi:hypothetical protein